MIQNKKIDILYSVLIHDSPECLMDLVDNVIHFNAGYNIKIVVNSSPLIYQQINGLKFPDEVLLNPLPKDKIKYSYDILEGHINNFIFCESLNFKYYIPLASNCMFFKQMHVKNISNLECQEPKEYSSSPMNPHIIPMLETPFIVEALSAMKIKIYDLHRFHEGVFYTKEQYNAIKSFLVDSGIHNCAKVKFIAEETLLPILEMNLFGKMLPTVFSMRLPDEDMERHMERAGNKKNVCIIKPIERVLNCQAREYLRNIIKNETNQRKNQ